MYVNAFQKIAREIKFDQLSIFFRNKNKEIQIIKGVTLYQYMILNSQEIRNSGYIWSEDLENLIHEVMGHIARLFARDMCSRSYQSSGAKTCKQVLNQEDLNSRHLMEIYYN